jgi:hypothetical protein
MENYGVNDIREQKAVRKTQGRKETDGRKRDRTYDIRRKEERMRNRDKIQRVRD